MRILFITLLPINSNSSAMIRNNALIQGFLKLNCEVELITLPPNKNLKESLYWDKAIEISYIVPDNNQNINLNLSSQVTSPVKKNLKDSILSTCRSIYKKISIYDGSLLSYLKSLPVRSILKYNEYDLIISSSDPKTSHLFAKKVIDDGIKFKKWIEYWGDPLTQDITNKTIFPKKILKRLEKNLFSKADKVVYVSPFTLNEQKNLFSEYADIMYYQPVPYIEEILSEKFLDKSFMKIGYFGDYYSKVRDIMPLYNAVSESGNIDLEINGKSDLILEGSFNIKLLDRIPYHEVKEKEKDKDILVCILNSRGNQLPGKLFHYAATDKPILVLYPTSIDKEILEYLKSFERYILCENNTMRIREILQSNIIISETFKPSEKLHCKYIARGFLNI